MLAHPSHPLPQRTAAARRAFTLIEVLVVIGIIAILSAIAFPAIKALTKSNDHSQASNVVRAYLSTARNLAISQQRMAGVVFFEETSDVSSPSHDGQTAMQLIVEDYNQRRNGPLNQDYDYQTSNSPRSTVNPDQNIHVIDYGMTVFIHYSADRQYLPRGMKVATLENIGSTGSLTTTQSARAIVFDAHGNLVFLRGLATPSPGLSGVPGTYPWAYRNWNFLPATVPTGTLQDPKILDPTYQVLIENTISSPGFFLYSKLDYDDAVGTKVIIDDATSTNWLKNHSDVIIVNSYTGNVLR